MVIGAAEGRMRWRRFRNLMSEFGALFVGVVEKRNEVAAGKVAGGQFFACKLLIVASFRKEIDDLTLARHVHSLVVADEGEQEAAGDEGRLEEEDWRWV